MRIAGRSLTIVIAAALASTPAPAAAQVRVAAVATVADARGELTAGDTVSIVLFSSEVVTGKLVRLGDTDLEIQPQPAERTAQAPLPTVTIPHGAVRSIERFPDSTRNGVLIGTGIGAGWGLGMFVYALAVDRNEIDEWGAGYALGAALGTGLGAFLGWAVDQANSKPRIRFDVTPSAFPVATTGPSGLQRPRTPVPQRLEREGGRFVVAADFGWLRGADTTYRIGVPLEEGTRTMTATAVSLNGGVFVRPNMSVWGEVTRFSPSTVAFSGLSLCAAPDPSGRVTGAEGCAPLTDWPVRTAENQEVALYSLETRMRYNVSGLFGLHTPSGRRVRWTMLMGVTSKPSQTDYREQKYVVTGPGSYVPVPTYGRTGPYEIHKSKTSGALTFGGSVDVAALPRHLSIVPNVRFELGAAAARVGAAVHWTF